MDGKQFSTRILGVALLLGLVVDTLFYQQQLGISLLLFVLLLLGALVWLGRSKGIRPLRHNLWLIPLLLFFAAMTFIRANPLLTFLNVTTTFVLLTLVAHFYTAGQVTKLGMIGYPLVVAHTVLHSLGRAAPLVRMHMQESSTPLPFSLSAKPLLRGVVLATPVLLLFTLLLASADAIFAQTVTYLFDETLGRAAETIWRGVWVVMAGWVLAGALTYALTRAAFKEPFTPLWQQLGKRLSVGLTETAVVQVLVNLLFGLFVAVQFKYLFGGQVNINTHGFTYSEYARRGFWEIVVVSILTLALLLAMQWGTRLETRRQQQIFNAFSTLTVLFVLIMLASAFARMLLYEEAYGFTQLRLYSHVYMVWLGILCVWFLVTLWWRADYFALGALLTIMGFIITLNIINPDAFITRQNLVRGMHFSEGTYGRVEVDTYYLTNLSNDAIPVLEAMWEQLDDGQKQLLGHELTRRRAELESLFTWSQWPSFHWGHWRAYRAISPSP